jgi:hypothetical protein
MMHAIQEFLATSPHTKEIAGISIGVCLILGLIGGFWMLGIMSRYDRENIKLALLIPFFLVVWGFLNREDANTKKPLILMLISLAGFCLLIWLLPRHHSP